MEFCEKYFSFISCRKIENTVQDEYFIIRFGIPKICCFEVVNSKETESH